MKTIAAVATTPSAGKISIEALLAPSPPLFHVVSNFGSSGKTISQASTVAGSSTVAHLRLSQQYQALAAASSSEDILWSISVSSERHESNAAAQLSAPRLSSAPGATPPSLASSVQQATAAVSSATSAIAGLFSQSKPAGTLSSSSEEEESGGTSGWVTFFIIVLIICIVVVLYMISGNKKAIKRDEDRIEKIEWKIGQLEKTKKEE
jgi:hypothetical protein